MWHLNAAQNHLLHPDGPAAHQGVALACRAQQRALLLLPKEKTSGDFDLLTLTRLNKTNQKKDLSQKDGVEWAGTVWSTIQKSSIPGKQGDLSFSKCEM